ncbi:MAG TPA: 2-hydroxyacyl-CoA dehydratase, partial [Pyrinomonadaceae bacterium]|nr:2-hydroxyacyl-CoA dehydratase [Pyrinomonadaceae bacterium]
MTTGAINCEDIIYDLDFSSVREWKSAEPNRKAIGYFPVYAPVEIIHACGMLPVGLNGAGDRLDIQYADARFGSFICSIIKTTLELGLTDHLAPFDGLLFSSICDSARNLAFVMKRNFPDRYIDFLHLPHNPNSPSSVEFLLSEYRRLIDALNELGGEQFSDDALRESIALYNENRALTRQLYLERSERPHVLRTTELYPLIRAGNFLPVAEHSAMLRETLADLPTRTGKQRDSIRVVIEGSFCEQPPLDLIRILEEAGCYLVDDDLVLGPRWFVNDVP